jgi:enoyl-CoA hydratase
MAEVLIGVEGRVGRLTLNCPAALNALTLDMVRLVDMALSGWAGDPGISRGQGQIGRIGSPGAWKP